MLEIRNLRAGYGQVEILRGVDLDVGAGEIVAVLGSNGVGKSTLNNNISALYKPFGGSIRFQGEEITGLSSTEVVRRGVIHVPEGRRIFPNLSVLENLELGSLVRGKERRARNLERVTAIFPRLKERFSQLAGTLFNVLFNLSKFMAYETRDPFVSRQVSGLPHCAGGVVQQLMVQRQLGLLLPSVP